ncbi:MAG: TIGR02206 family membrane protein [bacterium]|nr:TIGR02206 family membrane protein [bacterium]
MATPPTVSPLPDVLQTYDWASEFRAFTTFHWLVFAICVGSMALLCVIGKRLLRRGEDHEARFRKLLAWSIILSQGFIFARRFVYFDLQDSLPLHMCRLGVIIAAWQLLTLDRRARSLTLFWGLGLSSQIFFTPYLDVGYGHLSFWIYWLNHVQIVGVAIYDIVVLGYRPRFRDLRFATLAGVIYALITIGLNVLLGTNYSYLGEGQHDGSSIVDKLGPFPQRTIWMIVGAFVIFCLIYGVSRLSLFIRTSVLGKPPPRFVGPPQRPEATLCQ